MQDKIGKTMSETVQDAPYCKWYRVTNAKFDGAVFIFKVNNSVAVVRQKATKGNQEQLYASDIARFENDVKITGLIHEGPLDAVRAGCEKEIAFLNCIKIPRRDGLHLF